MSLERVGKTELVCRFLRGLCRARTTVTPNSRLEDDVVPESNGSEEREHRSKTSCKNHRIFKIIFINFDPIGTVFFCLRRTR